MEATDHKLSAWVPTVHFLSRLRSSHYHFSFRSKINKYITCCRATWNVFVNLTSQMALKCGENKIEKDVFRLVTSVGQKKFWVPTKNRTSDLRIPGSDALPLSHRDSTVSEVYYEVHMTRFLHTARISSSIPHEGSEFFLCSTLVTGRKTSFSISLQGSKLTISLILYTNITLSTLLILAVCNMRVIITS